MGHAQCETIMKKWAEGLIAHARTRLARSGRIGWSAEIETLRRLGIGEAHSLC